MAFSLSDSSRPRWASAGSIFGLPRSFMVLSRPTVPSRTSFCMASIFSQRPLQGGAGCARSPPRGAGGAALRASSWPLRASWWPRPASWRPRRCCPCRSRSRPPSASRWRPGSASGRGNRADRPSWAAGGWGGGWPSLLEPPACSAGSGWAWTGWAGYPGLAVAGLAFALAVGLALAVALAVLAARPSSGRRGLLAGVLGVRLLVLGVALALVLGFALLAVLLGVALALVLRLALGIRSWGRCRAWARRPWGPCLVPLGLTGIVFAGGLGLAGLAFALAVAGLGALASPPGLSLPLPLPQVLGVVGDLLLVLASASSWCRGSARCLVSAVVLLADDVASALPGGGSRFSICFFNSASRLSVSSRARMARRRLLRSSVSLMAFSMPAWSSLLAALRMVTSLSKLLSIPSSLAFSRACLRSLARSRSSGLGLAAMRCDSRSRALLKSLYRACMRTCLAARSFDARLDVELFGFLGLGVRLRQDGGSAFARQREGCRGEEHRGQYTARHEPFLPTPGEAPTVVVRSCPSTLRRGPVLPRWVPAASHRPSPGTVGAAQARHPNDDPPANPNILTPAGARVTHLFLRHKKEKRHRASGGVSPHFVVASGKPDAPRSPVEAADVLIRLLPALLPARAGLGPTPPGSPVSVDRRCLRGSFGGPPPAGLRGDFLLQLVQVADAPSYRGRRSVGSARSAQAGLVVGGGTGPPWRSAPARKTVPLGSRRCRPGPLGR